MSSTSGSTWMATAKPRRMYIPEEYVFTGASMNSSSSAKATISSKRRSTSLRVRPSMIPLMTTFSRPQISGWKPAPSSISAEIRPSTTRLPRVGLVMPATSLSRVDLPEPFSPMTPKVEPRGTSKDTPSRAVNVSSGRRSERRLPVRRALFRVLNWFRWRKRR